MNNLDLYKKFLEQRLSDANALPFFSYTSKDIFNKESQDIFYNGWVFIGHENEVSSSHQYKVINILGESIIIIRDEDDNIRALSNHCRHRGTQLLDEGKGKAKKIVCPYHAWTYNLEGHLKGTPFVGKEEVTKKSHCLPQYQLEIFQGLIFINISGNATESPKQSFKNILPYLRVFDTDRFRHSYSMKKETWNCNWKIAMENAMESYHLFAVHKETLEKNTPTKKAYYIEGSKDWALTGGAIDGIRRGILQKLFSNDQNEKYYHYILFSLPPNFVGILTYDSFGWIQVVPTGVNTTDVYSAGISPHAGAIPQETRKFMESFFEEDKMICERMQKSMSSPLSHGGKLVELERVLINFRHYLAKMLFESPIDEKLHTEYRDFFLK